MPPKKKARGMNVSELESPAEQGNIGAKRELARRLLEGDEVDKNEAKAVSLLDECVALGNTEATLMLINCCALGYGMVPNPQRAEELISEAAAHGSKAAQSLMDLINAWKEKNTIEFNSLNKN